jgi:AraC family transcriptional regulator
MLQVRANLIRYAPDVRMNPHTDGCRRLSVLVAGRLAEGHRRREEIADPGSVALKAAGLDHHNRFGPNGTTIISAIVPDRLAERLGCDADVLRPWQWHHAGSPTLEGLRLAAALRRNDGAATEGALRNLLRSFSIRPAGRSPGARIPPGIRRIRDHLHTRIELPNVEHLAEQEGLHPVSLGRAFRRHFGCSITRYRQRQRIASVAQALVRTEDALVDIALDHGFADLSHMTRVFRREMGAPPGAFRAALRQPAEGLKSFNTEWSVSL